MSEDRFDEGMWDGTHEQALVVTVSLMGQVYRKVLEPVGLTTVQSTLLFRIAQRGGLSQAELARATLRDRANVTRVLEGLTERGLVVRRRDRKDRRKYLLYLTPLGRRTVARIRKRFQTASLDLRRGIAASDVAATLRFLERLQANYRAFLGDSP